MIELVLAKDILHKVLSEDVTFKKATKDVFSGGDNSYAVKSVTALVGCELRHHLLFKHILKRYEECFSKEELELCYLALANKFFLKVLNNDEVKKFIDEKLGSKDHKDFDEVYNFEGSPLELVKLPRESVDFISIRFNTPRWLIKMWSKHFGKGVTFKILKKNVRPLEQYVSVNTLKTSEEDLLKAYPNEFTKTESKNLLKVNPKANLRKIKEYKEDYFYYFKSPLKSLIDNYQNELLNEISLYSGADNSFVHELIVRSKLETGINLAVPCIDDRPEILRQIRVFKARNVNLFNAKDEIGMKAGISGKQELFYVFPSSSSFDKIAQYPDYLVHFNRENLDSLIEGERKSLEFAAPYLMEEGILIYIVDTLNKKESSLIIEEFLTKHNEFELIEEKQCFPFDETSSSLYFAVLKRKSDEK